MLAADGSSRSPSWRCSRDPLVLVFSKAFEKGVWAYYAAISDPAALSAIRLTLLTAAMVVPMNVLFGLAAAWAISKFEFRGKNLLTTLIDLPFSVSPVISGMIFVLLFGAQGLLGPFLVSHGIKIIYACGHRAGDGVDAPFIARELIPLMQSCRATKGGGGADARRRRGPRPDQPAKIVGFYGVVLCNARWANRGLRLFPGTSAAHLTRSRRTSRFSANEYQFSAVRGASPLTLLALVTLIVKNRRADDGRGARAARATGLRPAFLRRGSPVPRV